MITLRLTLAVLVVAAALCTSAADAAKTRKPRAPHVERAPARHVVVPPARESQIVTYGDRVLGADPDPRIRHQLLRDLGVVFGGEE